MIPFDKTTRVGWNFEGSNPNHPSHLLSPQVQRKPFDEMMGNIQLYQVSLDYIILGSFHIPPPGI